MSNYQRDDFTISTDREKLDINFIYDFLSHRSYWAQGRARAVVEKSIENSLCFGVFSGDQQVGFARLVTDFATFAWLCDVFIAESHRGLGLGKWLIETIVGQPEFTNIRRIMLATRDAHELYRRYGCFESLQSPERWMTRENGG